MFRKFFPVLFLEFSPEKLLRNSTQSLPVVYFYFQHVSIRLPCSNQKILGRMLIENPRNIPWKIKKAFLDKLWKCIRVREVSWKKSGNNSWKLSEKKCKEMFEIKNYREISEKFLKFFILYFIFYFLIWKCFIKCLVDYLKNTPCFNRSFFNYQQLFKKFQK